MIDVAVVGGGPAGLSAAIFAAQAGRSVVVFEPKEGVIDKACGEGLMPGAVEALGRMGVHPEVSHPFCGVRYFYGDRMAEGRFPHGVGLGVRRIALHDALRTRAEQLGVRWERRRVRRIQQDESSVSLDGERAQWLLAADGLNSPIRSQLGLDLAARQPKRLGVRRHYAMRPWSPFVEVYWTEGAEAYVTPVDDQLVGVAILFDAKTASREPAVNETGNRYERLLKRFPTLFERLHSPCTAVRGAGPFERRVRSRVAGRVMLVGDAAGYLDPLTGEGIRLGLASSQAAVRAIEDGTPERYEADWQSIYRRYWWMTYGLLSLRRTPLRRLMVPALQWVPGLFGLIVGQLAEETLPRQIHEQAVSHSQTRPLTSAP